MVCCRFPKLLNLFCFPKVVFFPNVEKVAGETFRMQSKKFVCTHHFVHIFFGALERQQVSKVKGVFFRRSGACGRLGTSQL